MVGEQELGNIRVCKWRERKRGGIEKGASTERMVEVVWISAIFSSRGGREAVTVKFLVVFSSWDFPTSVFSNKLRFSNNVAYIE